MIRTTFRLLSGLVVAVLAVVLWLSARTPGLIPEASPNGVASPAGEPATESSDAEEAPNPLPAWVQAISQAADASHPMGVIEVQLLSPDGRPALDAEAWCAARSSSAPEVVRAGLQGFVEIKRSEPCDLFAGRFNEPVHVLVARDVTFSAGERRSFRVTIPEPASLSGIVTRPDGTPLPDVRVRIGPRPADLAAFFSARDEWGLKLSNAEARFEFSTARGPAVLTIDDPHLVSRSWRGEAPAAGIRLVAYDAHILEVRTLRKSTAEPLPGVFLQLTSALNEAMVWTDQEGRARVRWAVGSTDVEAITIHEGSLFVGKARLSTMPFRGSAAARRKAGLPDAYVTLLLEPHAGIQGTVVGPDGLPVASAQVLAFAQGFSHQRLGHAPDALTEDQRSRRNYEIQPVDAAGSTDAQGRFALLPQALSPPGLYRIHVLAPGLRERTTPILVPLTEPELLLTLVPSGTPSTP